MRQGAFPLAGLATLLLATLATAQDEGEGWKLENVKQAYELKLQKPPFPIPLTIPTSTTVGSDSFDGGRRPTMKIAGPGDVVWFYLLGLPEGELSNKREVAVDDTFEAPNGKLFAKGTQTLKRRGRKSVVLKSELVLTSDVRGSPLSGKEAKLEVSTTFDLGKGVMKSGQFKLTAEVALMGKELKVGWGGKLGAGETIDMRGAGFHVMVQRSIEKGSTWLKKATRTRVTNYRATPAKIAENQRLGTLALQCFALLRSGVAAKSLADEFDWMASEPLLMTYSVSLWIMALEARAIRREQIKPRAQTRSVARFKRDDLDANGKQLMKKAVAWLVATHKTGTWNYRGHLVDPERAGDRSNTQFAILALHSALASGVEVPRELWQVALAETVKAQEPVGPAGSLKGSVFAAGSPFLNEGEEAEDEGEGATRTRGLGEGTGARGKDQARGWAYGVNGRGRKGSAYGSMTAAGVSSLAIIREALGGHSGATQVGTRGVLGALRDGLIWLGANFSTTTNPNKDEHFYYWLYSLEKAMDTTGVQRLSGHEWFREAASALLQRQRPDGSWEGKQEETALALLVLNRATLPAKLSIGKVQRKATGGDETESWDRVAIEGTGVVGVRQLLAAMIAPEEAAKRLKLAQEALDLVVDEHRPRLIKPLSALFENDHKPTRRWAQKACREMAGSDDPSELKAFSKAFAFLRRAGEAREPRDIPRVRAILKEERSGRALRRQACLVLNRLRAVEAIPDLVNALESSKAEDRDFMWGCLVSLAGGEQEPYDPKASASKRAQQVNAWHAWYAKRGAKLQEREQMRRLLVDLGRGDRAEEAATALRALGDKALVPLTDALQDEASRDRAHALLMELSGGDLPADDPDAWRTWLRNGRKDLATRDAPAAGDAEDADEPEKAPNTEGGVDWGDWDEEEPEEERERPAAVVIKPDLDLRASEQGKKEWGLVPRPSQRKK